MKTFLKIFIAVFLLNIVGTCICHSVTESESKLSLENVSSDDQLISCSASNHENHDTASSYFFAPTQNNELASMHNRNNSVQSSVRVAKRLLHQIFRNTHSLLLSDGRRLSINSFIAAKRNTLMQSSTFYQNNYILAVIGVFII